MAIEYFIFFPKNLGGRFWTYFEYKYFLPLLLIFDLKFLICFLYLIYNKYDCV